MKLRVSALFASAIVFSMAQSQAGIIWDGGGANTNINTAANWDSDAVNALNGTTAAEFGTGGATATINTNASFTGITFNRDANFEIANGSGSLTVGSGGITVNLPTTTGRTHTISESNLILGASQTWTLNNNTGTARLDVSSVIDDGTSTFGITRAGAGLLVLTGSNTFGGGVTVNAGTVRINNSNGLGTGSKTITARSSFARVELDGTAGAINLASGIVFNTSGVALRNIAGNNTIAGRVDMGNGSGNTTIGSNGGTLTLTGLMRSSNSGNRALELTGTSTLQNRVAGVIQDNVSIISLIKSSGGKWIVSGTNTFTGTTSVSGGNLTVTSAAGLGAGTNVAVTNPTGGNVSVASGATLNYAAAADSPLAIGGTLAVTAGTGTTIGGSIGSGLTTASINVTGAASISDAAHTVNLFKVPGTTAVTGTYNLITGGAGSALNPATAPTLGEVFNNSDFTVGALSSTGTTLDVVITSATPLSNAYWVGGLAGSQWAVSSGTVSNWAATPGGTAQGLVPGSTTNVIISGDTPAVAPNATVLGADLTINSLTISDTANGLALNDDGYTLKLLADGLTMDTDVPASSIAAKVALDGDQTWTINSANALTVSGVISGTSALTKSGSGTLALAAANTYSGVTQVAAGTLALANVSALAASTLYRDPNDTGVLSYDVVGATTYNLGGLSGAGTLDAGGKTLSIGGNNQSTEFSGDLSNGALTKVGSGTLTLSGASTFAGAVNVNAGRLTLTNSDALGNGPKTVFMQGSGRQIFLANDITIPSDITFTLSSNSSDGGGLNNESGNNTIQGPVNISFGNPALNISATDGTLTISGNVTLVTTVRPLHLGGASEADNTISGNISENSAAILPVIKQGVGKWILSGTNTYKGDTDVRTGTLVLANGGSTKFYPKTDGTSNKITDSNDLLAEPSPTTGSITLDGALDIDLTAATTASSWLLVDVANLNETYGDNFIVTGFTETPAASGIWKKTVGADAYTFTESNGLLTRAAAPAGFTTWIATPAFGLAPADQDPTDDPDNDGIENLVEYVLNGAPNASDQNILPTLNASGANFVFTFTRQTSSAGDTTQVFQYGTDLTGWTDVPVINGGEVAITPDTPSAGLDQVVITVAKGTNTKLFGRLKVSKP